MDSHGFMDNPASFTRTALCISSGGIVWALHFAAIYGYTGLACARGFQHTLAWALGSFTAVGVAALCVIMLKAFRERDRFEGWMTMMIALFALMAVLWETAAVPFIAHCGAGP